MIYLKLQLYKCFSKSEKHLIFINAPTKYCCIALCYNDQQYNYISLYV